MLARGFAASSTAKRCMKRHPPRHRAGLQVSHWDGEGTVWKHLLWTAGPTFTPSKGHGKPDQNLPK